MKKVIATLLIMTFFIITATAQTVVRSRIKTERRVHRLELRRIRRIERRRRHRRIAVELNAGNSQKLQAVLYKIEGDKYRVRLA